MPQNRPFIIRVTTKFKFKISNYLTITMTKAEKNTNFAADSIVNIFLWNKQPDSSLVCSGKLRPGPESVS